MPLPLIPLAAVGVAALTTLTTFVVSKVKSHSAKVVPRRVAILGSAGVGKTTLLRFLELDGLLDGHVRDTLNPGAGGEFALEVQGKSIEFEVSADLPGAQSLMFKNWRKAVKEADDVWYLFRADLAAVHDPAEAELIQRDLTRLHGWIKSGKSPKVRVLLIGTHADEHPLFDEQPATVRREAESMNEIKVNAVKLAADVVIGSLKTEEHAKRLRMRIGGAL